MAMDTELGNAACSDYEALLEDYLDDELNAADAKRASEHWKNCAGCRAALEQAAERALPGPLKAPRVGQSKTL